MRCSLRSTERSTQPSRRAISSLVYPSTFHRAIAWSWIFLYFTQIIRISFRQLATFIAVIALGVLLHLVQNMLFLGWGLFVQELAITIGNRTLGIPSQEQVRQFYEQAGGWAVAQDPGTEVTSTPQATQTTDETGQLQPAQERRQDPYYLLMRLPGEQDEEVPTAELAERLRT